MTTSDVINLPGAPATCASIPHDLDRYSDDQSVPKVDNPLPHVLPEGENATPLEVMGSTASDKLVIIMVGLPATGKTHIAKRICRFLSFFHDIPSQIFNVGDYRRQMCGAQKRADFYDHNNVEGLAARKLACDAALADLCEYMRQDGVRVAALDATNSTKERRLYITKELLRMGLGTKRMFVESICDDEQVSQVLCFVVVIKLTIMCVPYSLILADFILFYSQTNSFWKKIFARSN